MQSLTGHGGVLLNRWTHCAGTPGANGLLVTVLVLLAIVIAVELLAMTLVVREQVVQGQVRERLRVASPVIGRNCNAGPAVAAGDCMGRATLTAGP